jgi:hypothetical protein
LEDGAKGLEKPAVGIDFLLILFLETKEQLTGDDAFFSTPDLR